MLLPDHVSRLTSEQIQQPKLASVRPVRCPEVGREHAQWFARPTDERGGLNSVDSSLELDPQAGCADEDRTSLHVFNDDALSPLKRRSATPRALADAAPEIQPPAGEAAMGHDLEVSGRVTYELNVAEVRARDGYGGVHDLEEDRAQAALLQ